VTARRAKVAASNSAHNKTDAPANQAPLRRMASAAGSRNTPLPIMLPTN
jgi:hypothetical protein